MHGLRVPSTSYGRGAPSQPAQQQVDLATQAEAERGVEERGGEREGCRDDTEQGRPAQVADEADNGEAQPDGLGEAWWAGVLELGRRGEAGADGGPEQPP